MKRIPNIRFKGFEDEWEEKKLGKCFIFLKNNTLSRKELTNVHSDIKNIHYGDILIKYGSVLNVQNAVIPYVVNVLVVRKNNDTLLQNGDIIIADTAEDNTVGKCSEIQGINNEIILSGLHTIPIRPQDKYARGFLGYFMNSPAYHNTIIPLIQGTKVSSISRSAIATSILSAPTAIIEQQQIATFFDSLDALISRREKEVEKMRNIKRALLEKMFPQGNEKVPQIRFGEFKEEWKEKELSSYLEVSEERNAKNQFGIQDVLSVSGDYGVVNQIEFQGRSFAGASLLGYRVLHKGEVVYTKSPLKANPFGIIKSNKYCDGIVSSLYGVYHVKEANADFIQDYFDLTSRLNAYLRPLVNKGAKNTLLITDEGALKGLVSFPKEKEQNAISNFIRVFDKMLSARERQVTLLKNLKCALLEQMFVNE